MHQSEITLETMRFLRGLTNDGELTGEEVWSLGKWLNQHRSAWDFWPGKLLIEPLEAAFEDWRLSLDEMHALAKLISGIEHEWAAHLQAAGESALKKKAKTFPPPPGAQFEKMEAQLRLPILNLDIRVPCDISESEYDVSLASHSCECDEWKVKRQGLEPRHLGRCCKHVAEGLAEHASPNDCPSWLSAVFEDCRTNGRGINPDFRWRLLDHPNGTIALARGHTDWINIFAPSEESYERFGYNVAEERWAYGVMPAQEREILKAIQSTT